MAILTAIANRLMVPADQVTAVRARVEDKLGVVTRARPEGDKWGVYWESDFECNLDFLRPDILPPEPGQGYGFDSPLL